MKLLSYTIDAKASYGYLNQNGQVIDIPTLLNNDAPASLDGRAFYRPTTRAARPR